ncbi:MAG TPA: LPS export ABC transporter periplasmic protein LptC [Methylomirabilota bacterium]|nr:LPS export ABC transporter periplasmic protein LptC [Methylomirabilota bacterium]
MRRVPFIILTLVVVFASAVIGLLISKNRTARVERVDPAVSRADYRIKEVHLQEERRDGSRWQLDAEQGEIFEDRGRTVMKKVTVRVVDRGRSWTVKGDEGELAQESKDVEIRGNVVLSSSDGMRIETTRLYWTAAEQRAWTDAPVVIYRSGAVVHGRGFESKVAEEATAVGGRVRATFTRERAPREAGGRGGPS